MFHGPMDKRNEQVSQGPGVNSCQRHLCSRDWQVGKGSCGGWSLGMGFSSRAPLAVDGRMEGKLKGQSFDVQRPLKPSITFFMMLRDW